VDGRARSLVGKEMRLYSSKVFHLIAASHGLALTGWRKTDGTVFVGFAACMIEHAAAEREVGVWRSHIVDLFSPTG
jgi:hypothetical protein